MPSDADRIIGLYQRHAAAFDRDRSRSLSEKPWLDRFLGELPGRSVLDLGCGHGEPIARYLVEQGCAVTGIDASPPLIEMARGRFPDQAWIVGDMRTLDLGARFNGILAWHSFFHLSPEDQRAMFRVFAAHTQPGSVLMLVTGPEFGEAIGCYEGEPFITRAWTRPSTGHVSLPMDSRSSKASRTSTGRSSGWPRGRHPRRYP